MSIKLQSNYSFTTPEGYQVVYAQITPDIAAQLLDANTNNRKVRKANLARIGEDMLNGRWVFNGDTIRIDDAGVILDGQHRLIQVESTGVTIDALVVTGLPSDVRATIDTNAVRSAADELQMQGYANSTGLAALTAAIIRLESSDIRGAVDPTSGPVSIRNAASTSRIVTKVHTDKWLEKAVSTASTKQYKGITRTMGAVLYRVFSQIPGAEDDADYFFARLRDGAQLPLDSPILRLRNMLDNLHANKQHRTSPSYIAGLTIKAWNAFRRGTPVKTLTFRMGGASPEKFPEPI